MERNHLSTRISKYLFRTTLTILVLLMSSLSYAVSGITYHGRILKPNGQPVNSASVRFRIQIRTPGAENCLLWDEQQSRDLSATAGIFSITIADTSDPTLLANTLPFTLEKAFSNRTPYTGLTNCSSGSAYTPSSSVDGRNLQVYFREAPTDPWEQMPVSKINFVPLALNSVQLEGYGSAEFLKIDPLAIYSPLTSANVNTLVDIIAGTNTQYLRPASVFAGDVTGTAATTIVNRIRGTNVVATAPTLNQVLKYDGSDWVPSADATGTSPGDASYLVKGIVQIDTSLVTSGLNVVAGVLSLPNVIVAGGPIGSTSVTPVITYDAKGRLTAVTTATINDTSKLPLAGGTMSGPINMGVQNITNASSVAATNFSGRNLVLNDNDINTVTISTPVDITANYALTLPTTAGTAGFVLATNGTGTLSWVNPSAGSVTNVTSTNAYITVATGTTTPAITAVVGTAANTLAAGDDARISGALQTSSYNADLLPVATCTSVQKPSWNTVSDAWECLAIGTVANATNAVNFSGSLAGDVSGTQGATSVDKIKGKTVSAATVANQIMIYDGVNWVNNILSGDATLTSTGALTLASTVTAGTAGSASAVPTINYDAKGRITSTSSAAYQDATGAVKGIVQVGSNLTIAAGTISLTNADALAALGFTPLNKAGDTMTGNLGLNAVAADPVGLVLADKGKVWYNTTSNQVKYWDGAAAVALGVSGAGLTSLGGQSGSTQTFANAATGTAPAFSSAANVHTLNIPLASGAGVTSGTIAKTDYDSFVAKLTSPLTTKGDILTRDATTHVRLPVGTDGQVLSASSVAAGGLAWITPQNGDITDVVAGAGLTGGAATGSATVDVIAGTGIVVNANDVAVDVGTTVGKIVQVQALGKLPILDGSDLINLDAGDISAGTLPIIRGGTGLATSGTANQVLGVNAGATGLEYKTITAGTGVTITNAANAVTINATGSGGTVTSVGVSVPAYMTSTGGPVTTTGTIALGFGSQAAKSVFAAPQGAAGAPSFRNLNIADVQSSVAGSFLTGAGCTAGQALTYISASDTIACSTIVPTVANTSTLANTRIWVGDVGNKAQEVLVSGDATLASTGALTLASTVTAGAAGSASAVPTINYDAKGRITSTSSTAYQDATAGVKGVVSVGTNLTVTAGAISLTNANALAAIGYTPLNKAGDNMSGTLGLFQTAADPSTAGWNATQKGYSWFNTTSNSVKYWDGSAIQALGVSGAGLTSLGGQSGSTQTFASAAAGTAPAFSSAANVHTLNIPLASGAGVTSGTIAKTDYDSFVAKLTSPLTTKGDILTRDATTHVRLPVGTNGQVLSANSVALSGLEWITPVTDINGLSDAVVSGDSLYLGLSAGSSGLRNTGVGTESLDNVTGDFNTGLGYKSMDGATSGSNNTSVGARTLELLTGASADNVAIGYSAGQGTGLHTRSQNVLVGSLSGGFLQTGSANLMLGYNSGNTTTTGSSNILIGPNIVAPAATTSNHLNIGNALYGDLLTGNIGIGAVSSGAKLEVAGQVKITGGVPGLGKVLTSDAAGLATWENPAATGITTLNTLTAASQTFATGATGTAPAFSSAVSTHTLNIPLASGVGVTSGTISKTDYDKFNSGTTISGTSGGIPYYNSATTQASSGLLTANGVLLGGGAGLSPTSTTAGTANQVLRIPAGGGAPAFGLIDLTTSMLGALPIANGGTNSAIALTNGKVMVSSTGSIVEGMASATAKTANTFVMRDGTGGVTGALGTFDQFALNGSVAGTLNVLVPSSFTTWSMTLPTSAGTTGQVLSTDGTGTTSWITGLTATSGFMQNGNSFGGTASLGTNDNFNVNIETNGTTKMTVRADGNVGIGNTNPAEALAVTRSSGGNVFYQRADAGYSQIIQQSVGGYGMFSAQTSRTGWTANQDGDYLFEFGASGFDGGAFRSGGSLRFQVAGATGVNDMPTAFVLQLTPDGAGSPVERFRVTPAGDVGIGTNIPSEKLHIVGNLRVQGATDCTLGNGSGGTNCTSDQRLKSNIKEIINPMGKILALRGVEFDWNEKSGSPGRHDIGVIAQDVEKVFPTAVITDNESGYKKVDYAVLVAPLIQAFKELFKTSEVQSRDIASLKQENTKLKAQAHQEKLAKDKEIAELKARMEKLEKLLQK